MQVLLPRRQFVMSLLAVSAGGALLAACSEEQAAQPGTPPAANPPATPPAAGVQPPASQGSVDMADLMEPGSLPEMIIGNADAPVTIVEYASMTCPHCATFHANTLPVIKERYVDTGKARVVFREFPFDPRAEAGFMLARCSDDKYFADGRRAVQAAAHLGRRRECPRCAAADRPPGGFFTGEVRGVLDDQKLLDDIRAVRQRGANDFKVESTPTFFINGDKYSGALSVDEMSAIIESKL
jgi:protein-disulfide isomerase